MSDLREFLLARIEDEERLARDAASEGMPSRTGWQWWTSKADTTPGGEIIGPRGSVELSPSRALAECQTKRLLLDLSEHGCGDDYERVQKALALPYAGHQDYRRKWSLT